MSGLVQLFFVKKCLEISAEIAEKKDDDHQIFELFGKCIMLGFHEDSTSRVRLPGSALPDTHSKLYVRRVFIIDINGDKTPFHGINASSLHLIISTACMFPTLRLSHTQKTHLHGPDGPVFC